ncbi:hypothetical protein Tco_0591306 [Tanacetum coccineum]
MDLMSLYQLAIYSGVVSPLATRKVHKRDFDLPLPVKAFTQGLVNPLAPRKGNHAWIDKPCQLFVLENLAFTTKHILVGLSNSLSLRTDMTLLVHQLHLELSESFLSMSDTILFCHLSFFFFQTSWLESSSFASSSFILVGVFVLKLFTKSFHN